MVAHGSGQTSVHSLNRVIPTPAMGVDDKTRLNTRGMLSAGLGRGDVERGLCDGRGGHFRGDLKHCPQPHILFNVPSISLHQASCTGLFLALPGWTPTQCWPMESITSPG